MVVYMFFFYYTFYSRPFFGLNDFLISGIKPLLQNLVRNDILDLIVQIWKVESHVKSHLAGKVNAPAMMAVAKAYTLWC